MKKRFIMIGMLLIIVSVVYGEMIDWGIHLGPVFSNNLNNDDVFDLKYDVYQEFSMLDTTVVDTTTQVFINDKILVGNYSLSSSKQTLKPTLSFGAFLSYKISEGRNKFIIQPEINWVRYSYEFDFDVNYNQELDCDVNNAIIIAYYGSTSYVLADTTEVIHNYNGEEVMYPSQFEITKNVETTFDYIKIPLLFKVQREFLEGDFDFKGFVYAGPSFGFKFMDETKINNDLKEIFSTYDDQDSLTTYTSERIMNSVDDINTLLIDVEFGFGWKFNEVFGIGLGKDYLTVDLRNKLNLNEQTVNDVLKKYSFNLLFGYHF